MNWHDAPDIKLELKKILTRLDFPHIDIDRIFCFRTTGSKSKAYARIWSFPKVFQQALNIKAAYVIEVLNERFNKLSTEDKKKVLIHELLHIPKNFSGSLLPHRYGRKRIGK